MTLAIRPQVFAQPPSVSPQRENILPSTEWDADQLADYVRERLSYSEFFGRKTALQLWLAGRGLLLVKTKLKAERKWTSWAKQNGIKLTTAYQCMEIAKTFPDEDSIHGLTTVEVKQIAGVAREERKPSPGVDPDPVVTDSVPRDGDVVSVTTQGEPEDSEPLDLGIVLGDILRVVESLTGTLGAIDPASVPAATIASIVDHLGRLAAHAVSL